MFVTASLMPKLEDNFQRVSGYTMVNSYNRFLLNTTHVEIRYSIYICK